MEPHLKMITGEQASSAKNMLEAISTSPSLLPEFYGQMVGSGINPYAPVEGNTVKVDFKFKGGVLEICLENASAVPRMFQAVHNGALRETLSSVPKFTEAIPKVGHASSLKYPRLSNNESITLSQSVFAVPGEVLEPGDANSVASMLAAHGELNLIELMVLGNETYDRTGIGIDLLDTTSSAITKELGETLLFCAQMSRFRHDPQIAPEYFTKLAMLIVAGADLTPLQAYESGAGADRRTLLQALCQMAHDGHPATWAFGDYRPIESAIERLTMSNPLTNAKDFDIDQVDPATGKTALHYAVEWASPSVIQALLNAGADPTAKVVSGTGNPNDAEPAQTVYSIADGARRRDAIQILEAVTAQNAIAGVLKAARKRP